MNVRTISLCVLLVASGAGCVQARFTQTRSEYKPHRAAALPEVFVDRLPSQPYDSVGIIEVVGAQSLSTVLKAAASKGMDVGCDVVVDRSIYPVQVGLDLPRWTVTVLEAPPADAAAPRRVGVEYLGYGMSPIQSNANQQQQNLMKSSTPATHQPSEAPQFICGIYRPAQAPAQAGSEQAPAAPSAAP